MLSGLANGSWPLIDPTQDQRRCAECSTSHAGRRVEIAAKCGHNLSFPQTFPKMTLTFEDFPPGRFGTFGPRHVTRDEIVAFAAEFIRNRCTSTRRSPAKACCAACPALAGISVR